ncbi:hypothetical protein [Pelagibacterium sp.]|uniref:hypothetical protein n=1 Tax=Pelagibacterium sp. TaxID=1967288 RepID=UPI003A8E4D3E
MQLDPTSPMPSAIAAPAPASAIDHFDDDVDSTGALGVLFDHETAGMEDPGSDDDETEPGGPIDEDAAESRVRQATLSRPISMQLAVVGKRRRSDSASAGVAPLAEALGLDPVDLSVADPSQMAELLSAEADAIEGNDDSDITPPLENDPSSDVDTLPSDPDPDDNGTGTRGKVTHATTQFWFLALAGVLGLYRRASSRMTTNPRRRRSWPRRLIRKQQCPLQGLVPS